MLDAGAGNEKLMVVTADLGQSSGLDRFRAAYPDKFLNVGIAEQNMFGIAAGLANEGYNTFTTTFAPFATMRAHEQLRLHLGYVQQNIKAVGLGSGISMGNLGNTHYGLEDLALMRAVPGLTVLAPADGGEIVKTVQALMRFEGPVYLRLTGAPGNPVVYTEDYEFEIGKAIPLREGGDVSIIACGTMVHESLVAAKRLQEEGISAAVINMHTVKPLDTAAIDRAQAGIKLLVTVEEHSIIGGLGGAVAEYMAQRDGTPRQLIIGLPDDFGKVAEYKFLLKKYGLTGDQIAEKIKSALRAT